MVLLTLLLKKCHDVHFVGFDTAAIRLVESYYIKLIKMAFLLLFAVGDYCNMCMANFFVLAFR